MALPRDWQGDDPVEARLYLDELKAWKGKRDQLVAAQDAARSALDAAEARLGLLTGWAGQLQAQVDQLVPRRAQYDLKIAELALASADIARIDGEIADLVQSYAVVSARLLGGPPLTSPVVLLPLRLETHWTADELLVRIFPDEIGIDSHDPRLTAAERAAGDRYWSSQDGTDSRATAQAWDQLVRQTGAPRAAWVAQSCDPSGAANASTRDSAWSTTVAARLLPDRYAVVAISDGTLRATGENGGAARFVTWGRQVSNPLDIDLFADPGTATWLTDFAAAEAAGVAVRVPIGAAAAPIDLLLVFGIRSDPPDVAGLLAAHGFTGGLEVLPDGTATNNSDTLRAAHDRHLQSDTARQLLAGGPAPTPGTAGAQLAQLLGIDPATLAGVRGTDAPRDALQAAMAVLVRDGVDGALRSSLGAAGAAWPVVTPTGPGPTLRIGRQPYGVLPATAPGRWVPLNSEQGRLLTDQMHAWALATGPAAAVDPAAPPRTPGAGRPRAVTAADATELPALLFELPQSLQWTGQAAAYAGVDALVGPADGTDAPSAYLETIRAADPSALAVLRPTLPMLLAQVAIAAKLAAGDQQARADIDTGLHTLAAALADSDGDGRPRLAKLLTATLDAASHRFDAWLTGAVTERLRALRDLGLGTTVGAFSWLTDLRPADRPRSEGHIHAPSIAHAATAAVLRSGYLSEAAAGPGADRSRLPLAVDLSSSRVRGAERTLGAVRHGQPLAAVLGFAFEQDLVTAGLQRYLASFRKLTRFRTGTALEGLEDTRSRAARTLSDAKAELGRRLGDAADKAALAAQAAATLSAAEQRQSGAETAAQRYTTLQTRRDQLQNTDIPQLIAAVAAFDASRPVPGVHHHTVKVPVLP